MRKVILLVMVTLDGFFDGPGEGLEKIDWHHAEEEWEDYSVYVLEGGTDGSAAVYDTGCCRALPGHNQYSSDSSRTRWDVRDWLGA